MKISQTGIPTPEQFAKRLIELYGGKENATRALDARLEAFDKIWALNIEKVGRVVRAHLVVEHFLTFYLVAQNPLLGSVEDARLTFSQKVALLRDDDVAIAYLFKGLSRLNAIRNRLAHNLDADVTPEDAQVFLSVEPFNALRKALSGETFAVGSPIEVLEDFARHAAVCLMHGASEDVALWQKALMPVKSANSRLLSR